MRFGKGGTPVGSYVLVGLRMQLGETLHMQAREQGGLEGAKEGVLAKRKGKVQNFFRGWGKQPTKEVLLDVPSMAGYVYQSHIKKAS